MARRAGEGESKTNRAPKAVGPDGGDATTAGVGHAKASGASGAATEVRFEEALARLEELVGRLEVGELPLEETIETFEEGQKLLRICTDLLNRTELRVKEILRRADGTLEEHELKEDVDDLSA
jgi:exodeoxyribonuclease VII small subunit